MELPPKILREIRMVMLGKFALRRMKRYLLQTQTDKEREEMASAICDHIKKQLLQKPEPGPTVESGS